MGSKENRGGKNRGWGNKAYNAVKGGEGENGGNMSSGIKVGMHFR